MLLTDPDRTVAVTSPPPHTTEEVRIGRGRVNHLVVTLRSGVAEDVEQWAMWSLSYHLSDDRPLCGTAGEQGAHVPGARPCGPCESLLELLEYDIDQGRWAKAEALGGDEIDAPVRAIVRERLTEVGW